MSAATASSQAAASKRQQELQLKYTNFKNSLTQLASKIGEVENEAEEHQLVLESLKPVPADRKCFRLINGVLVERSVGEVIPALETNAAGLKTVLEGLVKEYKKKQQEMEDWKKTNNIQVVNQ